MVSLSLFVNVMGGFNLSLMVKKTVLLQLITRTIALVDIADPKDEFAFKKVFATLSRKPTNESDESSRVVEKMINDIVNLDDANKIASLYMCSQARSAAKTKEYEVIIEYCGRDKTGKEVIISIELLENTEMQMSELEAFKKRSQLIMARAYSAQTPKYEILKPVYSLVLCKQNLFLEKGRKDKIISSYSLRERDLLTKDLNDMHIIFFEISKCPDYTKLKEVKSNVDLWCLFFKQPAILFDTNVYDELKNKNPILRTAFEKLQMMKWSADDLETYESLQSQKQDWLNFKILTYEKAQTKMLNNLIKAHPEYNISDISRVTGLSEVEVLRYTKQKKIRETTTISNTHKDNVIIL